jgi:hypothetical protein
MDNSVHDSVTQHNPSRIKQCAKCKKWLPHSNFAVDSKERDGLFYQCRTCKAQRRKQTYDPHKVRIRRLRNDYGITLKDYDQMLAEQGGVCAVCHRPETHTRNHMDVKTNEIRRLSVDHDHNTGDARALLCSSCNVALGRMDEDPERIRSLADYADWCRNREPNVKIIQLPMIFAQQDVDREDNAV